MAISTRNGTTGAWAGEIGQVQMLPRDIIEFGVDGDGDGHVNLKTVVCRCDHHRGEIHQGAGLAGRCQPWFAEVYGSLGSTFPYEKSGLRNGGMSAQ
jgi:hypothetical protein